MKFEIPDDIAKRTGFTQDELLEILAVSLYKLNRINGVEGGHILGTSEIEFHGLLEKYGQYVNYDENELAKDIDNLKGF